MAPEVASAGWELSTDDFTVAPYTTSEVLPTNWTDATTGSPDAFYYVIAERLFLVADFILVLVGLIGNSLTLAVMLAPQMRGSTVAVYLSALAVADTLVLLLDFLNNWIKMGPSKIYLLGYSHHFCRFHRFIFNVCYTYAAWLVAMVTLERFVVVWFPFKARAICTVRHAILSVCILPLLISVIYLYNLWAWHINKDGDCDVHPDFVNFQNQVGPWLSAVVYSYIPVLVIILCNSAIAIQLRRAGHQRAALSQEDDKGKEAQRKITIMVVIVSVTFLVLTVPLTVWYVVIFALGKFIKQGPKLALGEIIILILGLCNHAINFFIYVLTSDSFRRQLMRLFRPCCRRFMSRDFGESSEGSAATSNTRVGSNSESVAETPRL